jgi:hypothetical protein
MENEVKQALETMCKITEWKVAHPIKINDYLVSIASKETNHPDTLVYIDGQGQAEWFSEAVLLGALRKFAEGKGEHLWFYDAFRDSFLGGRGSELLLTIKSFNDKFLTLEDERKRAMIRQKRELVRQIDELQAQLEALG